VVKDMCNLKQLCTQSGGLRPFGVSLLVAGIDSVGISLFETDPTGLYYQYKATVIGEGEPEIEEMLHKEYKETMTMDEGLQLAIKMLKKVLTENFKVERLDAAMIPFSTKQMEKVSKEKLEKLTK
jgi:proteasome alpha subunit